MLVAWWTFNSAGNQGGKLSATLRNLEMAPTLKYGASQKPQKSPGQMTTRPPGIWNEYGWSWVKGLIIGVGHLEHAPLKWWAWMGAAVKKQPSHLLHDSTLVGGWTAPTTFANWIPPSQVGKSSNQHFNDFKPQVIHPWVRFFEAVRFTSCSPSPFKMSLEVWNRQPAWKWRSSKGGTKHFQTIWDATEVQRWRVVSSGILSSMERKDGKGMTSNSHTNAQESNYQNQRFRSCKRFWDQLLLHISPYVASDTASHSSSLPARSTEFWTGLLYNLYMLLQLSVSLLDFWTLQKISSSSKPDSKVCKKGLWWLTHAEWALDNSLEIGGWNSCTWICRLWWFKHSVLWFGTPLLCNAYNNHRPVRGLPTKIKLQQKRTFNTASLE